LRSSEPGVTSPEIKKNNPIANSAPATVGILSTASVTPDRRTSWTVW